MSPTDRRTRIEALTDAERAQMDGWADRWIAAGLSTARADRATFEAAARDCYRFAGLEPPKVIIWVDSPLVLALAAPIAAALLDSGQGRAVDDAVTGAVTGAVEGAVTDAVDGAVTDAVEGAVDGAVGRAVTGAVTGAVRGAVTGAVRGAVTGAVEGAVTGAVEGAVTDAVDGAVGRAVHGAVEGAVTDAVDGAVGRAVHGAVTDAVRGAVRGAVHGAVEGAVTDAVRRAVRDAVRLRWSHYLGGQFWVGGWWGPAWYSFFREVCHLDLPGDLWDRARAYEQTAQSACWWWPHRDFIMVCERPTVIATELVDPALPRGWGSHRLHREDGPAVAWPDGWGVYSWHGVRVEPWVIETPAADLTVGMVHAEPNAEVRRVLIARMGMARYLTESQARPIQADDYGRLYEIPLDDGRSMRVVRVINGTPEPEGERADCEMGDDGEWYKVYWLRVPSRMTSARQAVAWTNWHEDPATYEEVVRT